MFASFVLTLSVDILTQVCLPRLARGFAFVVSPLLCPTRRAVRHPAQGRRSQAGFLGWCPTKISLREAAVRWRGTSLHPDSGPVLPLISPRATEEREELILALWCPHTGPSTPWWGPAGID